MELKINGVTITEAKDYTVDIVDIDDSNSSLTMADGSNTRDRITTKREIKLSFGTLSWSNCSKILTLLKESFVEVYYADPELGIYTTKIFSTKSKSIPYSVTHKGELYWEGLSATLNER